ncbi:BTB/POZ domain-containing protein 6-A-like [Sitodiplosis mosellana]|uniref:BTB/POZ domain-containing protein 6-A-like n=1 Tax=Sitodiplosis mosellana TaxID=263140 RepID=UPI00244474C2|nr:BTB/POZ domain-containing protein 6-A-like [Sitodiplosis mosellana]
MSGNVFEQDNKMACSLGQKLYLNSKTADTKFVFKDSTESVVAHKNVLSVVSQVFDTMFYGSLPENGDILIVDASPEAFKQFLQFFHLAKVRLTSEYIFQVANLCKKYQVNDGLKLCEFPMQQSLAINNMCSGYATAKLLEMENVIKFCEKEIKQKATEVLKSFDFLECDYKLLDKILQLVSSKCSAPAIVDACMAWAKAKCVRNGRSTTDSNLKLQLNGLFHRIPFDDLSPEQFYQHRKTYKRFLDEDDLESIVMKTLSKKAKTSESIQTTEAVTVTKPADPLEKQPASTYRKQFCIRTPRKKLLSTRLRFLNSVYSTE